MRIYDGHAGKVEEFRREPPDLNFPCCENGICNQHLDEYLARKGIFRRNGWEYHTIKDRVKARLDYAREHGITLLSEKPVPTGQQESVEQQS